MEKQIFSPIFPPDEHPIHPGWYYGSASINALEALEAVRRRKIDQNNTTLYLHSVFCWWWDGKFWRAFPDMGLCLEQNRYWFGLVNPTPEATPIARRIKSG